MEEKVEEKAQKPRAKKKKWILLSAGVLIIVVVVTFILIKLCNPAIYGIDITVDLNQDGSARITEVWDVKIVDGGEYFITKYDLLKGQDIHDLTVHDETGREYTPVENWNVEASGSDKYGKSGMVETKGGYELCWGIYGDYGKHTYTVQYTMDGLLQGYQSKDAIYQTFVADNLISSPKKVSLTIQKEGVSFTPEDTRVWGFGTKGEIYVKNGKVVLRTKGALKTEERVAVLVGFDEMMFSPIVENMKSFGSLKSQALTGSSYEKNLSDGLGGALYKEKRDNLSDTKISIFVGAFFILIPLYYIAKEAIKKKRILTTPKAYKDVPYSRNLPWNGDILLTYGTLNYFKKLLSKNSLINAFLLRWIYTRQIDIIRLPSIGKTEELALQMYQKRDTVSGVESELYDFFLAASGADFILQKEEFKEWNKKNPLWIQNFLIYAESMAYMQMQEMGICQTIVDPNVKKATSLKMSYSPLGEQYVKEMFGFKKYLENFTIINEREIKEVELWEEYLVFAQIFGINEKVKKQFEDIYPTYFTQSTSEFSDMATISSVTGSFCSEAFSASSGSGGDFSGGGGSGSGGSGGGGGGGGTR